MSTSNPNQCVNCKTTFSCGCQKAKAIDGKTVCKICLNEYNKKGNNKQVNVKVTGRRTKVSFIKVIFIM